MSSICQNASSVCNPAALAPNCTSVIFNYATCTCECTAFASSSSSSKPFVANTCGNGVLELRYNTNPYGYYNTPIDEECDDGNNDDDDGCFANCATMIPPSLLGTKARVSCHYNTPWDDSYSVWFDRIDPKLPTTISQFGSIPTVGNDQIGLAGQALTFASPHPDDGGREKIWLFGSSSGTNLFNAVGSYKYATSIYSSTNGIHWDYRAELPVATRTDRGDLGISIVKYRHPSRNATELWLFGGKTYDRTKPVTATSAAAETHTDKVFISQDGMNWSVGPALPYKVLNPHAAVLNGKIYVIAESVLSKLPWDLQYPELKNTRMMFSYDGTQWKVEPELLPVVAPNRTSGLSLPITRLDAGPFTSPGKTNTDYGLVNHNFVSFKDALYVIGGQFASGWFGGYMYNVYKFDGSHWTHVSSFPGRLVDGFSTVYQNRLWVMGGGYLVQGGYASCEVYSTANGVDWTWEQNFMPSARVNGSALTYKLGASDALWILGGSSNERRVQVMQTNYVSTATGAVKTVPYCLGSLDYAEPRCDVGSLTCPPGYSPSCYARPKEQTYWGVGTQNPTFSPSDGLYHDLSTATKICSLASPILSAGDTSLECTPASDVVSSPLNYQIDSNDYYSQTTNYPSSIPNFQKLNSATCNNCPDFSDPPSPRCVKNEDPSISAPMTCSINPSSSSSSTSSVSASALSGSILWAEAGKINVIQLDGTGKKPFYVAPTYKNPSTQATFYYAINSILVDHDNRKVYWSMQNPDWVTGSTSGDYQIVVADINSNGVAANLTVLQKANNVIYTGLALDGNGNLYFAQMPAPGYSSTSRIRKLNLTTQQMTEIFTISSTSAIPSALGIDAQNSLLVWTKQKEMYASDLTGVGAHKIAQSATNIQNLLSLDRFNQRIYWNEIPTGTNTATLRSTTYDGTITNDLLSCMKGSASAVLYPATGTFVRFSPYDGNTSTPGKILATGPDGTTNPVAIVTTGTVTVTPTALALNIDVPTSAVLPTITSPVCVSAP